MQISIVVTRIWSGLATTVWQSIKINLARSTTIYGFILDNLVPFWKHKFEILFILSCQLNLWARVSACVYLYINILRRLQLILIRQFPYPMLIIHSSLYNWCINRCIELKMMWYYSHNIFFLSCGPFIHRVCFSVHGWVAPTRYLCKCVLKRLIGVRVAVLW